MRRVIAAAAVVAVVAGAAAPASSPAKRPRVETLIIAVVGPGPVLTVKWLSEAAVTRLKPGHYYVLVQDRSNVRNFHLRGPGVNRASPVKAVRAFAWHLVLRKGVYRFWSDPQKRTMHGTFRVV